MKYLFAMIMFAATVAMSQSYRTIVYDVDTRESHNYVKFMVPTNVYMGYDLTTNPEHALVEGNIDWSIGKMAELTYDSPITLSFENIKPWVTYTLRLAGEASVTWPNSVEFLPVGTTNVANSSDTYKILVFENTNTQYVVKLGAGEGASGDARLWSMFEARQNVDMDTYSVTNTTEYGFTNNAALYVEGSNLLFRIGD